MHGDVLLKDIAQHIGVDVLARGGDASVEMPAPLVEEIEEMEECLVLDVDVLEYLLDVVEVEHAAIEVWDATILLQELLITLVIMPWSPSVNRVSRLS